MVEQLPLKELVVGSTPTGWTSESADKELAHFSGDEREHLVSDTGWTFEKSPAK